MGLPVNWIVADVVRLKDGILVEHWDVIQDESTKEQSKSGNPMFGDAFPNKGTVPLREVTFSSDVSRRITIRSRGGIHRYQRSYVSLNWNRNLGKENVNDQRSQNKGRSCYEFTYFSE